MSYKTRFGPGRVDVVVGAVPSERCGAGRLDASGVADRMERIRRAPPEPSSQGTARGDRPAGGVVIFMDRRVINVFAPTGVEGRKDR